MTAGVFAVGMLLGICAVPGNKYLDDEAEEVPAPQWRPDVANFFGADLPVCCRCSADSVATGYTRSSPVRVVLSNGDGSVVVKKRKFSGRGVCGVGLYRPDGLCRTPLSYLFERISYAGDLTQWIHLISFRTQKLSTVVAMVLERGE